MQPTTMAMLLVLDRAPDESHLRLAFARAVDAVPRLTQHVADAPLDLTLPRWETDPTFDLDYHLRRHTLAGSHDMDELFREIGPFYEAPLDRSRPLWEARVYDGLGPAQQSAVFFKLHHAVADGVGANAIFAALTDAERASPPPVSAAAAQPAPWPSPQPLGGRVWDALRDQAELSLTRAAGVAGVVVDTLEHPQQIMRALQAARSALELARFDSHSPLKSAAGRARRLSGLELPFDAVRRLKHALGGSMIDVILTIMARAIGKWYVAHHIRTVRELMTLVPVNLRRPEEWAEKAHVGNVATGILVPLPIRLRTASATYREIHRRMEAKKADPLNRLAAGGRVAESVAASAGNLDVRGHLRQRGFHRDQRAGHSRTALSRGSRDSRLLSVRAGGDEEPGERGTVRLSRPAVHRTDVGRHLDARH